MNILCIYHKDCADGFAAALAVKLWADESSLPSEFIPAHYGDTAPDVTGKDVLIVDFSYPRETLLEMNKKASSLKVIDHHKTAQESLKGLDFCLFDMDKSGAVLTWEYLLPNRSVPELFLYIQDRDLWKWEYPLSNAISAGLQLLEFDLDVWGKYIQNQALIELVDKGQVIVSYQEQCINKTIRSEIPMVPIAGHTVPCINTTHLISETGNELAKGHPFCAMYFETAEHRIYSLRSAKDGIDVSEIAKLFGGGGHFHAAGFKTKKPDHGLEK